MPKDSVQLISVDDHVIEPPNVWVDRLSSKWGDAAPHIVEVGDGMLDWQYNDRRYPLSMQGSVKTRIFHGKKAGQAHADEAEQSGAATGTLAEKLASSGSEIVA